jgi:hypothetical protein
MRTISALAALCLIAWPAAAETAPANTLQELFAQLDRCLAPVRVARGTDVTIQFMLNRRGGLIGKPRITHAHWEGDETARKATAASIASGFNHCLPAAITDGLGGAIAGRLIVYRLRAASDGGA